MADTTAPHGARTLGALPAPAFHRPWFRYVDPVDGAQGAAPAVGAENEDDGDDGGEDSTDWKAEARKWEDRAKANLRTAKANEDAARQLKKIEDDKKTDAQRLADLETENKRLKHAEQVREWTKDVAKTTGVPANLLRGTSREEIEAHAEDLKTALTAPGAGAAPGAPGAVPGIEGTPPAPGNVSLKDQIAAAEKAGDRTLVASLKAMQLGSTT